MKPLSIDKKQARRILLAHQHLFPPRRLHGKEGVLEYIRRVGCIQFDPLNIAGRNPEIVLQARIEDFSPHYLEELLYGDRRLLDGWDKMMSIYRIEDWPFFRRKRQEATERLHTSKRGVPVREIYGEVMEEIERRGPLASEHLGFREQVDWSWAPTKLSRAALESGYHCGELIIHHRVKSRKVYDLAKRHIPGEILSSPDPNPSEEEYHDWYVLRRIGSVGLLWAKSGDAWLGTFKGRERTAAVERLLEGGKLRIVEVKGVKVPFFLRAEDSKRTEKILSDGEEKSQASIIAPLDNLIWDRKMVEELFGFSYRWEVYKPAAQREYGYYVLPVLYGDKFIARFEPGKAKGKNALVIKNWWWEPEIEQSAEMREALRECFSRFTVFLRRDHILLEKDIEKNLSWLIS